MKHYDSGWNTYNERTSERRMTEKVHEIVDWINKHDNVTDDTEEVLDVSELRALRAILKVKGIGYTIKPDGVSYDGPTNSGWIGLKRYDD